MKISCWSRVSLVDDYSAAMPWRMADVGVQVGGSRRIVVGMVTVRCWTSGNINVVVFGSARGSETHFLVGKEFYVVDWRYVRDLKWSVGGFRLMADGFGRNLNLCDKDV